MMYKIKYEDSFNGMKGLNKMLLIWQLFLSER